jgi:hypothetical protein
MRKAILILILLLSTTAKAQTYNCTFLAQIMSAIDEQKHQFASFSSIVKREVEAANREKRVFSRVKLNRRIIDSLVGCCGYQFFFDDNIFHVEKNKIILVDTFKFFDNICNAVKEYGIIVANKKFEGNVNSCLNNVVELQSIKVYNNYFIIALRHINSENEIHFYFEMIAGLPPKLYKVLIGYL